MDDLNAPYFKYWGKADKDDPLNKYHLFPYHCLDMVAVGKVLLDRDPLRIKQFSRICGINPIPFAFILIFFLALFDFGKCADKTLTIMIKPRKGEEFYRSHASSF